MEVKCRKSAPQQIGDYDVLEQIGTGGMGKVYKARHRTSGDVVAIKTASPAVANSLVLRQRFAREFRAALALEHPNIVRALDFGQQDNLPYLVMELVDGQNLGDRIEDEKRLPEAEVVGIATQIGQALHAAHRRGIIHRDVKPDNILLTADGRAKLADLGLVKDLDGDTNLTQTCTILGTPNFMAPEQFTGSKNVDARCDVYSLGATLYMAVTGQLPFRAKGHIATLKKKITNEITPPRQLVRTLSERFNQAVMRALHPEPRKRPASCLAFLEELTGKSFPESPPVTVSPAPPPEKVSAKSQRKERRATLRYPSGLESNCRPLQGVKKTSWEARVKDISARGIGLLASRRFEVGTLLIVELKADGDRLVRLMLVRVVRVQEEAPRKWILGCKHCRELTPEEVQTLLAK
jgi:serine/threonine protein kinase